jgi:DNA-directed RNA polymerase specialized sigma24 family protein
MAPRRHDAEQRRTGNDPMDQAGWDFCVLNGYEFGGDYEDEADIQRRVRTHRRLLKAVLALASPQERAALEAALTQLRAGQDLNWEEVARSLGKSSGAVKTQVRRVIAKFEQRRGRGRG